MSGNKGVAKALWLAIAAAVVEVDYLRGLLGEINGVIDHPHVPDNPTAAVQARLADRV